MVGESVQVGNDPKDSGKKSEVLFTHQSFSISYNQDRVIEVNLTTDNRVEVAAGAKVAFTFSVVWIPTEQPFESRFERYLDSNFFEHQVSSHSISYSAHFAFVDSLVFHFQLFHDGCFPLWSCVFDLYENFEK
jgi:hypothetical protein